jgi:hypothetical protein
MTTIVDLAAAKAARVATLAPSESQNRAEVRTHAREVLIEALRRHDAGEVDECVVLLYRHTEDSTDDWDNMASYTTSITRWVGRLEITKSDWIDALNQYRSE